MLSQRPHSIAIDLVTNAVSKLKGRDYSIVFKETHCDFPKLESGVVCCLNLMGLADEHSEHDSELFPNDAKFYRRARKFIVDKVLTRVKDDAANFDAVK